MRRRWKLLLLLSAAQFVLIAGLLLHTRAMQREEAAATTQLQSISNEPDPNAERLTLIQSENERLKKDLATIPSLEAESKKLEQLIAAQSVKESEIWTTQSNRLAGEINETRRRIDEIATWEKDRIEAEVRQHASERLAQKAAAFNSDDYSQTESTLKEVADRTRDMLTLRRELEKMPKTPEVRATFRKKMDAAWSGLDAAMKRLGDDTPLYRQLPANPADVDNPKTPLFRSVVPDLHGVSATLYLDGTVEWSPPLNQALAK